MLRSNSFQWTDPNLIEVKSDPVHRLQNSPSTLGHHGGVFPPAIAPDFEDLLFF